MATPSASASRFRAQYCASSNSSASSAARAAVSAVPGLVSEEEEAGEEARGTSHGAVGDGALAADDD